MDVTLYKNFSLNKINKNITQVAKYTGVQMVEAVNDFDISIRMTVPTDTLKWDNVNYFEFDGAYYFLESVDKQANSISIINGRLDVLMTFKDAINSINGMPDRTTSHGSSRIEDTDRRITVDSDRTVVTFPNSVSELEGLGFYVMVTAQKGYVLSS